MIVSALNISPFQKEKSIYLENSSFKNVVSYCKEKIASSFKEGELFSITNSSELISLCSCKPNLKDRIYKILPKEYISVKTFSEDNGMGIIHYIAQIRIQNFKKVIEHFNKESVWALGRILQKQVYQNGKEIYFYTEKEFDTEKFRKQIVIRGNVTLHTLGSHQVKTFEGGDASISKALLAHSLSSKIYSSVTVMEETTVVLHLTPAMVEKIGEMIKKNGKLILYICVDKVVYTVLHLQRHSFQKDIRLVKCNSRPEALQLAHVLSAGSLPPLEFSREESSVQKGLNSFFFLLFLNLLGLLSLFYFSWKKKKIIASFIAASALFLWITYAEQHSLDFFSVLTSGLNLFTGAITGLLEERKSELGMVFFVTCIFLSLLGIFLGSYILNLNMFFISKNFALASSISAVLLLFSSLAFKKEINNK